ncbi:hypothetical protein ACFW2V_13535 [Streptomyces sp. NPDC058947]|uniref:hypothetical protein n=1 Tax=Streptomyces sp. NPDC058947 TaxID=3346675 RepID=UPI0036A5B501
MRYEFRKSKIWDGSNNAIDEGEPPMNIKVQGSGVKAERKARAKLPNPGLGRTWILVGVAD